MKRIFIAAIVLVICVLMAGCSNAAPTTTATTTSPTAPVTATTSTPAPVPPTTSTPTPTTTTETVEAPTPGPDSLVLPSDLFAKAQHQAGEIRVTPGDTFTVNLAESKYYDRIWNEVPEIINDGTVELISIQRSPADNPDWQTFKFKALSEGPYVVYFKTTQRDEWQYKYEVELWTYALYVAVISPSVSTFPVQYIANMTTTENPRNVTNSKYDEPCGVYTWTENLTCDIHGDLEGKAVFEKHVEFVFSGIWMSNWQMTFTGTMNGKAGSFIARGVTWGILEEKMDWPVGPTSWSRSFGTIISGTGELAKLRGVMHYDIAATPVEPATNPPTYEINIGTTSGTFWYLA